MTGDFPGGPFSPGGWWPRDRSKKTGSPNGQHYPAIFLVGLVFAALFILGVCIW